MVKMLTFTSLVSLAICLLLVGCMLVNVQMASADDGNAIKCTDVACDTACTSALNGVACAAPCAACTCTYSGGTGICD